LPENGLESGFYTVKNTKSGKSLGEIALNIPKIESKEGFYTSEELSTLFQDQSNVVVIQDFGRDGLEEFVQQTKEGFPLWKYFLVLALLCLLAEVLLIRFLS
jgi:hypothetical protein